ncbi:MAG: hypothetical protein A4S08_10230 [Proteobacteria bacterium SG_bin4]|nr:MAG: hypothetical protein A4S08_10230 [Proteobacteria bacterium SG_bin4]
MKRITIVINASDMSAIRKVVFIAGANKLVIAQVPHRTCIAELGDWYCGTHIAQRKDHMRLEVMSDDARFEGVISAILSTAHAAKIESISSNVNGAGSKDSYLHHCPICGTEHQVNHIRHIMAYGRHITCSVTCEIQRRKKWKQHGDITKVRKSYFS